MGLPEEHVGKNESYPGHDHSQPEREAKVNNVTPGLLHTLFPLRCALCQLPSQRAVPLCKGCTRDLQRNTAACPRCALPQVTGERCGRCLRQPPPWDSAIVPWVYSDLLAQLIHRWKYGRERQLTPLFADLWQRAAAIDDPPNLLVPVPMHWSRLLWRGFNQAQLLAQAIATTSPFNIPVANNALRRAFYTRQQAALDARARDRHQAHSIKAGQTPVSGLSVALVDDVMTTGATARAAAQVLRAAGAREIQLWCLARTPAPSHRTAAPAIIRHTGRPRPE